MAKYIIDESTLQKLANAIRDVNGETKTYTPDEMADAVTNIMNSITYVLVDQYGKEYPAIYVDSKTVFDATANDIRIGTTAATDKGVTVGEKEIPAYYTYQGYRVITAGSPVKHTGARKCDYTKMQALVCTFNTSLANSNSTEKVAIDNQVYPVQSSESIAQVSVNVDDSTIDFGITNDTSKPQILRYFYYKEEI